jgi:UDP-glucose 4-epimerase
MRTLITGGAGFVGGHLAERLLADGHQVTCLDDLSTGNRTNIEHLEDRPGFAFVRGSILDERLMDALVSRSDVVFHLAAAVGVQLILARALEGIRTNVHGTEIVLECAYRHRTRTLIASTSEVYGKNPAAALSETEDRVVGSPQIRRWSYAEAKALDETMAHLYWAELGVPTVIARLFNIAGPRQTGRYGMVIPRFVSQAINGEPLTVYGDGQQTRSFCHVSDAVEGLVALVASPATSGQAFNIGCPEEVTIQRLAERVIALSGSPSTIRRVRYEDAYGAGFEDTMRRVPDITRARKTVGYEPQHNLDDIIKSVIQDQLTASLRTNGNRPVPAVAGSAGDGHVW